MTRGRPPYPDVLTPRQWEVLELVREGRSNGEIGRELGISTDGAKFHVSEILTKLGVSTRREAAEWEGAPAEPERAKEPAAPTACLTSFVEYCLRSAGAGARRRGRVPASSFQLPVQISARDDGGDPSSIFQLPVQVAGRDRVREAA